MATVQELVSTLTDKLARLTALVGAVLNGAVPLWVSGGSYTAGQLRKSPADGLFYIANTTHSSVVTDPSADAVNWRQFDLDGFAAASHTHLVADITDFDPADYLPLTGGTITGDLDIAATAGVELTKSLKVNRDSVGGSQHIEVICDGTANYIMGKSAEGNAKPLLIQSDDGGMQLRTIDASSILIYTGNVLRAQITPDGHVIAEHDVRVGTTSTAPGNGNTATGIRLNPDGVVFSSRTGSNALFLNRNTSNGDIAVFNREGVKEGSISVTTTSTSYNTTSDERVKENIVAAGDPGALIDAVQVRSFDMPHAEGVDHYDFGFVAQELYPIFPQAVTVGETEDDLWSVDHSKLVPLMMREIQSLRQRVAALEA